MDLTLWVVLGTKTLQMSLCGWCGVKIYSNLVFVGGLGVQVAVDEIMLALLGSQVTVFIFVGVIGYECECSL